MNTPKLTFIYAYPLDSELRRSFSERGEKYPSHDEVKEVMRHWKVVWQEQNERYLILDKLVEITKRTPERNLECFIFGRGLTPKSAPFMIPVWNREQKVWSDEKFIDLVIHEMLHIFITTNNEAYWKHSQEKYVNEIPATQNHVLLYALLNQVYQDFWQNDPIDFSRDNLPLGYARAIEIVKEIGYKQIIEEYWSLQ